METRFVDEYKKYMFRFIKLLKPVINDSELHDNIEHIFRMEFEFAQVFVFVLLSIRTNLLILRSHEYFKLTNDKFKSIDKRLSLMDLAKRIPSVSFPVRVYIFFVGLRSFVQLLSPFS
jgi:hypothetical protein